MIIRNRDDILSQGNTAGRSIVLDILAAGLQAIEPYGATRKLIRREGDMLFVGGCVGTDLSGFGDEAIDLAEVEHVYVIGAGKTVQRQAQALEDLLGDRLTEGAITIKRGEEVCLKRVQVTEGAHPVPDEHSVLGARRMVELARRATVRDLVFTVFSSGASSLCVLPPDGCTLTDVQAVFRLAIKYGDMSIIWRVMRYFSAVNSARILMLARPARSINLLMSFKPYPPWHGELPRSASWIPTWPPGPRRLDEAVRELRATPWWSELPASVRAALERHDAACEVPDLDAFRTLRFSYWQPIDYRTMLEAAAARAEALGIRGVILGNWWSVQSADAAEVMMGIARECLEREKPFVPPVALLSGGEMTVPVGNAAGIGGRNQEFVLCAAQRMAECRGSGLVVGSVDSDGTDGPGPQLQASAAALPCLAGGIADETTWASAASVNLDLAAELERHNSSPALLALKSAIHTGNTGICAGDLRVILIPRRG